MSSSDAPAPIEFAVTAPDDLPDEEIGALLDSEGVWALVSALRDRPETPGSILRLCRGWSQARDEAIAACREDTGLWPRIVSAAARHEGVDVRGLAGRVAVETAVLRELSAVERRYLNLAMTGVPTNESPRDEASARGARTQSRSWSRWRRPPPTVTPQPPREPATPGPGGVGDGSVPTEVPLLIDINDSVLVTTRDLGQGEALRLAEEIADLDDQISALQSRRADLAARQAAKATEQAEAERTALSAWMTEARERATVWLEYRATYDAMKARAAEIDRELSRFPTARKDAEAGSPESALPGVLAAFDAAESRLREERESLAATITLPPEPPAVAVIAETAAGDTVLVWLLPDLDGTMDLPGAELRQDDVWGAHLRWTGDSAPSPRGLAEHLNNALPTECRRLPIAVATGISLP